MLCCFRPAFDGNIGRARSSVHPSEKKLKTSLEKKIPIVADKSFSMHVQLKSSFERDEERNAHKRTFSVEVNIKDEEKEIALTHQYCQSWHPDTKEKYQPRPSHPGTWEAWPPNEKEPEEKEIAPTHQYRQSWHPDTKEKYKPWLSNPETLEQWPPNEKKLMEDYLKRRPPCINALMSTYKKRGL